MGGLNQRDRRPELMDQPDLPADQLRAALRALARVNVLSGTVGTFFRPLAALHARLGTSTLRVLDVASGGGDVAVRLAQRAAAAGLDWRVAGCDVSEVAVRHARDRAGEAVRFFVHDVLAAPLPGEYDAVICSLFLHHLDDESAVEVLRAMRAVDPRLILVSDLERSRVGYWLAWLVSRALTRSPVVHTDGPLSVQGAFTVAEARQLAERAGLTGATVRRGWPWRWLLTWRAD